MDDTGFGALVAHITKCVSNHTLPSVLLPSVLLMQVSALTSLFPPIGSRTKRQANSGSILSLLQAFNYDPSLFRPLVCSSDQLGRIVHFANISTVELLLQ